MYYHYFHCRNSENYRFVMHTKSIITFQAVNVFVQGREYNISPLYYKRNDNYYNYFLYSLFLDTHKKQEEQKTITKKMSTPSRRRLMRDFAHLQNNAPPGVSAAPEDNNIMKWNAVIFGPEDTPFEGGTFRLIMQFCEDYPNKAPSVKFMCKMFHPNVYADGSICLDVLQKRWSPTYGCFSFFLKFP